MLENEILKLEVVEMQVQMKRAGVWRRRVRNQWCAEKWTTSKMRLSLLKIALLECRKCIYCNNANAHVCSAISNLVVFVVLFVAYSCCVAFAVWHACFVSMNLSSVQAHCAYVGKCGVCH